MYSQVFISSLPGLNLYGVGIYRSSRTWSPGLGLPRLNSPGLGLSGLGFPGLDLPKLDYLIRILLRVPERLKHQSEARDIFVVVRKFFRLRKMCTTSRSRIISGKLKRSKVFNEV